MRSMGLFLLCLIGISVLFCVIIVLIESPYAASGSPRTTLFNAQFHLKVAGSEDKLLGGLLASGFDENSCLSRYQAALYRKASPHKPSPYLISKLRSYETLHKRCGPYTESYNKTAEQLLSGSRRTGSSECNYVVWYSSSGLGNRILTLTSTFLYALLTNRVLLVDPGADMIDLFCEPFPDVSWFRPPDLPLNDQLKVFNTHSPHSFGNLLRNSSYDINQSTPPSFLYLHLDHNFSPLDQRFFCDEYQPFLQKVPWLVVRSNNYFLPALFLMPSFEQELHNLFPSKETVFHHLGRYLFHPTNVVWGLITRYYQAYLAQADEIIGIQVRIFSRDPGPFPYVFDQIKNCTLKENLLPGIIPNETITDQPGIQKSKVVLMTSLSSVYFEKLKDMYWEHPTVTGEVIGMYQPSHEETQKTDKQMHNHKAWAEIYLLSLSDTLVISERSTFGYVAQGLGGSKQWLLYWPQNGTPRDQSCARAVSLEPCYHSPPSHKCNSITGGNTGATHVGHCEDVHEGLKLFDQANESQ